MSDPVGVTDVDQFRVALKTLRGSTHGDTLAVYLALKRNQDRLPRVNTGTEGVPSKTLEGTLDDFYMKRHRALGRDSGKVCQIFSGRFKPTKSYAQNNWRDFFRYGNGVSCLAPEPDFQTAFLGQHRSECPYLVQRPEGGFGCRLHPIQTRYIRGLDKPKLLKWTLSGKTRGDYKIVNLDDPLLVERIRPLASGVHLPSLIIALYFGASWSARAAVTVDQFVTDFHFASTEQVELLFAPELEDPAIRPQIDTSKQALIDKLHKPFVLIEEHERKLSMIERTVRVRAFAEAVREAYDYACAVCGRKVESIEGHWEVTAAHIFDHAQGGTDDIRNGIALCRTHHWAFDQAKLFTIGPGYELMWHQKAVRDGIAREGILHLPQGKLTWPDLTQAVARHREKTLTLWKQSQPRKKGRRRKRTEYP